MLLTYARAFAVAVASIEFNRGQLSTISAQSGFVIITSEVPIGKDTLASLNLIRDLCQQIPSLNLVSYDIDRIFAKIESSIDSGSLFILLETLQNRIMDELRNHYYFPVTADNAALYAKADPFGEAVFKCFPSARLDIQNAARCIIFQQATASVFHLMRVMEVGLRVLSSKLGIAYAPSWESHLTCIERMLGIKHSERSVDLKRHQALYSDLTGDLRAVKIAWRNPTMHIEKNYEGSEAFGILIAVGQFMNRMAESGLKEAKAKRKIVEPSSES